MAPRSSVPTIFGCEPDLSQVETILDLCSRALVGFRSTDIMAAMAIHVAGVAGAVNESQGHPIGQTREEFIAALDEALLHARVFFTERTS